MGTDDSTSPRHGRWAVVWHAAWWHKEAVAVLGRLGEGGRRDESGWADMGHVG
jgi:hypothetical protein